MGPLDTDEDCDCVRPIAPVVRCHKCGAESLVIDSGLAWCGGCLATQNAMASCFACSDFVTEPGVR